MLIKRRVGNTSLTRRRGRTRRKKKLMGSKREKKSPTPTAKGCQLSRRADVTTTYRNLCEKQKILLLAAAIAGEQGRENCRRRLAAQVLVRKTPAPIIILKEGKSLTRFKVTRDGKSKLGDQDSTRYLTRTGFSR